MEFTSSHKYIKNTSTDGTILTEHLLNISRGPWTSKRSRKIPMKPGNMKEMKKKRKKGNKIGPGPLEGGAEREECFPHSGNPPHSGETIWDREGALGD